MNFAFRHAMIVLGAGSGVSSGATVPVNTALPVISGSTVVGQTLATTSGTWTGFPAPGFTYQWQRDTGGTLPVNTVAPAITGTTTVGSTLTAADGTWTGSPTPTYTRQWNRNGTAISGATASTYLLVTADLAATITVTVTATNTSGSVNATSAGVGPITAAGAGVTMDPAFANGAHTLSTDHLTVTGTGATGTSRTTTSHSSGKYYFEFTIGTMAGAIIPGYSDPSHLASDYVISDQDSLGIYNPSSGWVGSSGITTAPALVAGHTYGMAIDDTAKLAWVKDITAASNWNANGTANPATGVNGTNYAGMSIGVSGVVYVAVTCLASGDNVTFNFGNTAYAGTAPSGFGNW